MKLIIVESPTKARTLSRFLGSAFDVEATMGHVRDLPKASLGVDIEDDFTPKYIIPKAKQKAIGQLKKTALKADQVILATDPDREGEAIAWHVANIIQNSESKIQNFKRIVFHEITESAIREALDHPRQIDNKLVDAQQARRVLDRLVGYKLSPLLWQKLSRRWLSAGRVQSVAVRLVVEREREIAKFQAQEYWTIEGEFNPAKVVRASLVSKNGEKYEKTLEYQLFDGTYRTTSTTIASEEAAKAIVADFKAPFTVSSVDKKEIRRSPPPPYTTSTMQQDAGRRLYFSAKRTMSLAQKLYEEGLITYHRTDSLNLSEKFLGEARSYIQKTFGPAFLPAEPRRFKTKSKVAQEAHEAIRPTNPNLTNLSNSTNSDLNRDHARLYELIWKRSLASQAAEAVFDSTTVSINSANGYEFQANGSIIKFEGFLKIIGRENDEIVVPEVSVGQTLALIAATPTKHMTSPPPRYTEASLVKALEEEGIGRPSTYAPIISTIQERQYITKEEKRLIPTELGGQVTDFLVQYFPDIMGLPFTAKMEDELDAIANGEKAWVPVIREFYDPFAEGLEMAYEKAEKVSLPAETIDEKCPKCASPLVIRIGRYGKFIACSTFPKCDYTRQFAEKIDMKCPRCGGDIVLKKSRRGKMFYGCSNWPSCTFAAWKKEDIINATNKQISK